MDLLEQDVLEYIGASLPIAAIGRAQCVSRGWSDADIARYRVDPDVEPPRLLAGDAEGQEWGGDFKRGDVRKVDHDIGRSKL